MNKSLLPFYIALCSLLSALCSAATPPNVIFISIDDLNNWPAVLKGHPQAKTPNIDRLAARGTLFTDAHCQFPLCGPSRASLMSGMHSTSLEFYTHMKDEELQQRAHEKGTLLLHEYFAEHGYKTMAVGKICHNHVPEGSVDMSGGREPFGPRPKPGFKWKSDKTSTDWAAHPETDEETADYRSATWAIDRLEEEHDKPFLLMTGFLRPHVPWFVPQKWFDKQVDTKSLILPPYKADDWEDIPPFAPSVAQEPQYPTTEWAIENKEWENIVQAYLACVTFVDAQVGRVLDALEDSEYADNTIVYLWTDHGYHLGEKGLFKKVTLWDRSTRVPMMVAGPGLPQGQVSDRVVSLIDMYPTLLDLCGLPANPKNEGSSLVPLLKRPEGFWNHPALTTLFRYNHSVTTQEYRYIRYEDGSEELYDRKADPNEWNNIVGDKSLHPVKQRLGKYLPN
ncbi:sulfatase [Opitutia bacterium ISCC 51]|nr:sulfatase [Opitutae bacterium ISCC 51]QXD30292.1 sulfatase [Opitutae bacterium ISCC 52]